jgi:hypothetical protein
MSQGVARFVRDQPLVALLAAVGVAIVGGLVDLQWHLTHDEFEGTSEQFRAHTVVWIGVLLVLMVTALAVKEGIRGTGYRLALLGAVFYVPVAVWHFIEHANGSDPEVAHVLLALADVAILTGGAVAFATRRRAALQGSAGPRE